MLPRFLRSALDSTPLSLYLLISRSVSFSLPLYHVLSPPYLSSSIYLSRLLPPALLSVRLSLSLLYFSFSLFLYFALSLSLPSIFLYSPHLSAYVSLPLSVVLFRSTSLRLLSPSLESVVLSPSLSQFCYRVGDSANRHCQLLHDRFGSAPIFRKSRKLSRGAANDRHAFALRFDFLVLKFVYLSVRNIESLLITRGFIVLNTLRYCSLSIVRILHMCREKKNRN